MGQSDENEILLLVSYIFIWSFNINLRMSGAFKRENVFSSSDGNTGLKKHIAAENTPYIFIVSTPPRIKGLENPKCKKFPNIGIRVFIWAVIKHGKEKY